MTTEKRDLHSKKKIAKIKIEVLRDFRHSDDSYVIYHRGLHGCRATVMKNDSTFRSHNKRCSPNNAYRLFESSDQLELKPCEPITSDDPEWSPAAYKQKRLAARTKRGLDHFASSATVKKQEDDELDIELRRQKVPRFFTGISGEQTADTNNQNNKATAAFCNSPRHPEHSEGSPECGMI